MSADNSKNEVVARESVYEFSNGFRKEAESMFGWLRHVGFNPDWDFVQKDPKTPAVTCITLPAHEVEGLRVLQRTNPARFGNAPEVKAALEQNRRDMEVQLAKDRERHQALTSEQRDWIEVIHRETGLNHTQALDLNETLHDLSAKHFKLCHMDTEFGLSEEQERAREAIECDVQEAVIHVNGVNGVRFMYDPRGTTVGLKFESGAYNSFADGGVYKVPLNEASVAALDGVEFWTPFVKQAEIDDSPSP